MHVLKRYLTVFVDLVYWSTLHFDIFNETFLPCRVPIFRGQKVVEHGGTGVFLFLFID